MKAKTVLIIAVFGATLCAQTATSEKQEKKSTGLYQRTPGTHPYQQSDDFFHASTKLVNPRDIDYGVVIERRRQAFLDASVANPFFWYSALTTLLLMALMIAYGLRVIDEKRWLWRAAEILTDVWNDSELARTNAQMAIEKHNRHMQECNRVVEAQASGRTSPSALEADDARSEVVRLRGELDNVGGERNMLKAKLEEKEKLVDNLSVRLSALEKSGLTGGAVSVANENGGNGHAESESKLITRINQLTQQLELEKQKNRTLKGA
jgi:hypothetical protein